MNLLTAQPLKQEPLRGTELFDALERVAVHRNDDSNYTEILKKDFGGSAFQLPRSES